MLGFVRSFVRRCCRRLGLWEVVREVKACRFATAASDSLSGKNVLITGGGSGIGLAIARKCIACGARVLISGRNADRLAKAAQAISSERLSVLQWDVTDIQGLRGKLQEAFQLLGNKIDVLVNNAGISVRQRPEELTEDVWDGILATNLKAPAFLSRAVALEWKTRGKTGVILNISSMAGLEPAFDAYSAAKCALNSLTKGLAREWARDGIRVNAIAPGVVVGTDLREVQRTVNPAGNVRCDWIPMGRYGVPDEIAELAAFLIGDTAAYITGAVVTADGGGAVRG